MTRGTRAVVLLFFSACKPLLVAFPDTSADKGATDDSARADSVADGTDDTGSAQDDSGPNVDTTVDTTGADSAGDSTCTTPWYRDQDGDGYGDAATTVEACVAPEGYVSDATDCDDTDATVSPGEVEIAGDGADNNCDGGEDPVDAETASAWTVLGISTNDLIGTGGVFGAGDLDGDGFDELVIAAPQFGSPATGAIGIFGADRAAAGLPFEEGDIVWGEDNGDQLGAAMASVGDVDGDGFDELVAVAVKADGDVTYVFDLSAGPGDDVASIGSATLLNAAASGGGTAAVDPGDADGDGLTDLLIGAAGEGGKNGAVRLVRGEDAWWDGMFDLGTAAVSGVQRQDALGTAVLLAEDLSGDGYGDLLACAPGFDDGRGACWLLPGAATPGADGVVDTLAVATFLGEAEDDAVGHGSQGLAVWDLDEDGLDEVIVGAPGYDGSEENGGAIAGWFSPASGGTVTLGSATLRVDGDGALGEAIGVAPTGLLVGAPTARGTGAVYLLQDLAPGAFLLPGIEQRSWTGAEADDGFGTTLWAEEDRDLDGDGAGDFVVSAPLNGEAANDAGKVYVLAGGW